MTAEPLKPSEVLPCPFCGSDELSHGWSGTHQEEQGVVQCHADGCGAALLADWEEQAIERWNRRAPPSELAKGDGQ